MFEAALNFLAKNPIGAVFLVIVGGEHMRCILTTALVLIVASGCHEALEEKVNFRTPNKPESSNLEQTDAKQSENPALLVLSPLVATENDLLLTWAEAVGASRYRITLDREKTDCSGSTKKLFAKENRLHLSDLERGLYHVCVFAVSENGIEVTFKNNPFKIEIAAGELSVIVMNPPVTTIGSNQLHLDLGGKSIVAFQHQLILVNTSPECSVEEFGDWEKIENGLDLKFPTNGKYLLCLRGKDESGRLQSNVLELALNVETPSSKEHQLQFPRKKKKLEYMRYLQTIFLSSRFCTTLRRRSKPDIHSLSALYTTEERTTS
jgi:hypothetical protein